MFGSAHSRRLFCPACDRQVFALRWRPAVGRSAAIVVLTLGAWLVLLAAVAAWHGLTAPGYRCPNCGGRCKAMTV